MRVLVADDDRTSVAIVASSLKQWGFEVTVATNGNAAWDVLSAERPPLAIASCGNAAFAASVLARAVDWPLHVFVPPHADPAVLSGLRDLRAEIVECPRREGDPDQVAQQRVGGVRETGRGGRGH